MEWYFLAGLIAGGVVAWAYRADTRLLESLRRMTEAALKMHLGYADQAVTSGNRRRAESWENEAASDSLELAALDRKLAFRRRYFGWLVGSGQ